MPKTGSHHVKNGPTRGQPPTPPKALALLALDGLERYKASGLAKPREYLHRELAARLGRVVSSGSWEALCT